MNCLSIGGAPSTVTLGTTIQLTAQCCASTPALSTFGGWLLTVALLAIGLLLLRRTGRRLAGLGLLILAAGGERAAQAQVCAGPFQWTAQSASQQFSGSGPTFSFTPTMAGAFVVTLTAGTETATATISASSGASPATLRVHYPAGAHTISVRGSAPGMSWTAGVPMTGSGDTFTLTLSGLAATAEWKPFLDDATSALGPNYHVSPGQTVDVYPHFTTTKGFVVTLIASFHSTVLNNDRAIYAYLPASYNENSDATYPVVYMQDGQNLWAALPQIALNGTWNVDTTFDSASNEGACSSSTVIGWGAQPLGGTATTCNGDADCASGSCRTFPEAIVIGVANTANRIYEYTPTTDPTISGGGGAEQYIQMLITELKPTVDSFLRTRPDVSSTSLAGSSLGGLLTAYAGFKHPEVFGGLAELSPSTFWNNDFIVGAVGTTQAAPMRPLVVYVDSGQGTADDESDTDLLAAQYLSLGYVDGTNFRHVIQPGAQPNETYWAQRFPGAMQLLLGER